MEPKADRPRMPKEYGIPETTAELLPWSHVDERMAAARHYWLGTTSPDGAPHVRPVDGVWLDGVLYFGGSPEVKWHRNLRRDGRACLHLDDPVQVVILHGTAGPANLDRAAAERLSAASNEKYEFQLSVEDWQREGIFAFRPERAFAWKVFNEDATRWRFD